MKQRDGTEIDASDLEALLSEMGFHVTLHEDLTKRVSKTYVVDNLDSY